MKKIFGLRSRAGFTFIEAVLTLTLVAGGILGVIYLFQQNVRSANDMEHTVRATYLAQERMEQIIQNKEYLGYNSIVSANYPSSENLTAQGFSGYTRSVSIVEVNPNDLATPQPNSQYKRLTVSVQVSGGDTVTLTTLLTRWGEQ